MNSPIITLTTDFGADGPYVASMKGVILGMNPAVRLVDICHGISPQDIRQAALMLRAACPYFPPGTIHLAVVDPGVGTARELLYAQLGRQHFVAPDNGLLSWVYRGTDALERIALREPRFWRPTVSATFHGRDILAPVAAHLSLGISPNALGVAVQRWVELPWPALARGSNWLQGEILNVDHFGNLITNIEQSDMDRVTTEGVEISCGGVAISGLSRTYADAAPGELLAYLGSSGLLEIAVRNGACSERLGVGTGSMVRVSWPRLGRAIRQP